VFSTPPLRSSCLISERLLPGDLLQVVVEWQLTPTMYDAMVADV